MTIREIVLLIALVLVILLYLSSKFRTNKNLKDVIKEVKDDLTNTALNVGDLVIKAKDIIFDESIQKAIKEFILIIEEKNNLAKQKGKTFLSGDDKKLAVISRITEWIGNLTGSIDNAVEFVEKNQRKIDSIIEEYVSFSNKMEGKATLSEAEKLIQQQLNN